MIHVNSTFSSWAGNSGGNLKTSLLGLERNNSVHTISWDTVMHVWHSQNYLHQQYTGYPTLVSFTSIWCSPNTAWYLKQMHGQSVKCQLKMKVECHRIGFSLQVTCFLKCGRRGLPEIHPVGQASPSAWPSGKWQLDEILLWSHTPYTN